MRGAALAAAGLLYLKVWLPVTHIHVPCIFHELTGLYCPGCGITRVVLSLLSLDVVQAFRYNPLVFTLIPLYTMYGIAHKRKRKRIGNAIMAVMLILTLAFGLLRNLPTFHYLAPTELL
ncbi:DUF2752 domain-containing protein [Paenibacillus sp. HJL G12]|uniref:DUF2752 domain-containing protein n=1 Tax=Paenibacillus dendrobii TaxID=2691084 RepID=A0A7X3IN25_9BACL|nr:DUF2752 domain-containing protein [Paenibacillus dendrobii]MWV46306.1 DUF2752 domain-containing protein [Paenibacillus dendrobii]